MNKTNASLIAIFAMLLVLCGFWHLNMINKMRVQMKENSEKIISFMHKNCESQVATDDEGSLLAVSDSHIKQD